MKRCLAGMLSLLLLAGMTGCGAQYEEVREQLNGTIWYYSGGGENNLNRLIFSGEQFIVEQVYFDGMGLQENGSASAKYTIDKDSLQLKMGDGSTLTVPYTLGEEGIRIGLGKYFTLEEIEAALQGSWEVETHYDIMGNATIGRKTVILENGTILADSASTSILDEDGTFFYYGPYTDTYTMKFGEIETDLNQFQGLGFTILNGVPTLMDYYHPFQRSARTELPGVEVYQWMEW